MGDFKSIQKLKFKKMKYVAAYMLAALSGEAPSKDAVTKILESVGADINAEQFDKVFAELDGKNVDEVVAEGMSKLASVPSGGLHQLLVVPLPVVMLLLLLKKRRRNLKKNPTLIWVLTCLDKVLCL